MSGIKCKMVVIYSLLVVMPLIVIISLFYFRSTEIIETKIRETTNQTLVETVFSTAYTRRLANLA
ncbi:hypothetical protein [Paenibacillus eucommiae]|uniref:Two-component sensor histidine kinase n=1 Tax=Paenibacillus eucommiae TaxID=1355755 RepID=A0ABS4IYU5_9BACL|nr:hypothetical protein [Paenibacillus eucommiae]MBP1991709.1 hypothetical protein [Paenibacillus eucommiae]